MKQLNFDDIFDQYAMYDWDELQFLLKLTSEPEWELRTSIQILRIVDSR